MDGKRWQGLWRFVVGAAATLLPVLWLGLVLANIFTDEIDDAALRNGELQSIAATISTAHRAEAAEMESALAAVSPTTR